MTYNRLTLVLYFGTLLALTATIMALWPLTMLASAQTATDEGVFNSTIIASGANETDTATENNNRTGAEFLFIQNAQSGSVSEVNATTSTLELSDVSDKTIMLSDRPERIVASESTADFIGNWSMGPNSFAVDPPNAVLVLDDEKQKEELAVIELYNPEYNPETKTLKYDIIDENETATTTTSIDLPKEFGQSTLVIDIINEPTVVTPNNILG